MLFDKVIAFDNLSQKIIIIANAATSKMDEEYIRCVKEIDGITDLIQNGIPAKIVPGKITTSFTPLFTKEEYCQMVEKAKNIFMKEIFSRWCFLTGWRRDMREVF